MKIFALGKNYTIVCNTKDTRNGFKHTASLCGKSGSSFYETKICYLNRTWERFTYETVLKKTIEENFKNKEKEKYLKIINAITY